MEWGKKREKSQIFKLSKEKGVYFSWATENKRIIGEYCVQLYANKLDNWWNGQISRDRTAKMTQGKMETLDNLYQLRNGVCN